jgi:hypothetical protein
MVTPAERLRKVADELQELTVGLRDTGILLSLVSAREALLELARDLERIPPSTD